MDFRYTAKLSAAALMENSWNALNQLEDRPILEIYQWKNRCATHGYFIHPSVYLNLRGLEEEGIEIARRPTGGGILFHLTDLAFAFYLPASHPRYSTNTLDNYAIVNGAVLNALQQWVGKGTLLKEEMHCIDQASAHFCMGKPTRYDVCIDGFKVAGGAQRRIRRGFLHQGSINLKKIPKTLLKKLLLPGTCVVEAMEKNSYPDLNIDPQELGEALRLCFTREFHSK